MNAALRIEIFTTTIALVLTWTTAILAQPQTLQNEAILHNLTIPEALEIIQNHISPSDTLMIEADGSPLSIWTAKILTDSCVNRNYFVYSPATAEGSGGYRIVLSEAASSISYAPGGRKWLLFRKPLKRLITSSIRMQLLGRGRIVESRTIVGDFADHIAAGRLRVVENPRLIFTQGTKIPDSYIKRWVEPLILTAATASVIYLFYSLRSNN